MSRDEILQLIIEHPHGGTSAALYDHSLETGLLLWGGDWSDDDGFHLDPTGCDLGGES